MQELLNVPNSELDALSFHSFLFGLCEGHLSKIEEDTMTLSPSIELQSDVWPMSSYFSGMETNYKLDDMLSRCTILTSLTKGSPCKKIIDSSS